jgi:hypothetical protein
MGIVVYAHIAFFCFYTADKRMTMNEVLEIQTRIYEIRGMRVMLDFDLAELYQVETKRLKEAVRRNIERFEGEDFMFEVTNQEYNSLIISLRSQFATSNERGGRRHMPFAFTEQGVAMLSSVLKSERAILVNRSIIRAFVAMRHHIMTSKTLSAELEAIKTKLELLERNDEDNLEAINDLSEDIRQEIDTIYQAIAALSVKKQEQEQPRQKIGFKTGQTH